MADEATLAISIAAMIISIAGVVPLYLDYFSRRSEKRIIGFEIERFKETVSVLPIESAWSIRILKTNRTIEHCMVILRDPNVPPYLLDIQRETPLPVWNKKEVTFETKIAKDGAANFRIPKSVNPFGMLVVVKDRDKELQIREFRDIPETSA